MRRLRPLLLLVLIAFVVRAAFLRVYISQHPARALATIPFLFEPGNIAFSIASGHGFSSPFRVETGPTAWMTPIYPLILAGIFRLFGTYTLQAFIAAAGLNVICSTLTCVPLYYASKRVGGTAAAALATALWVIFPNAILLPYESLFDASLSALLTTTILWGTLAVTVSKRVRNWSGYGLLWGLALMTNASLISFLPFVIGWTAYRANLSRALLAASIAALCCVPWTIRNYTELHAFIPLRSVGGLALWLGNNDQAQSNSVARLHPISNQNERAKYIKMGEVEYMREKQTLAIDYMLSHPAKEASLIAERFTAIWTGGSTNPVRDFALARSARFHFVILFNIFAALGAAAGIFVLWRVNSPYAFPLTVVPVVFPLVYYLALAPPRYRHPVDPLLLLLSAIAFTHLPKYRKKPLPGSAALLL